MDVFDENQVAEQANEKRFYEEEGEKLLHHVNILQSQEELHQALQDAPVERQIFYLLTAKDSYETPEKAIKQLKNLHATGLYVLGGKGLVFLTKDEWDDILQDMKVYPQRFIVTNLPEMNNHKDFDSLRENYLKTGFWFIPSFFYKSSVGVVVGIMVS